MKKHGEQRKLYHNFIDFKQAVDRVWHDGLFHTMKIIGKHSELINIIKSLYNSTTISILLYNQSGLPFPTIVSIR